MQYCMIKLGPVPAPAPEQSSKNLPSKSMSPNQAHSFLPQRRQWIWPSRQPAVTLEAKEKTIWDEKDHVILGQGPRQLQPLKSNAPTEHMDQGVAEDATAKVQMLFFLLPNIKIHFQANLLYNDL